MPSTMPDPTGCQDWHSWQRHISSPWSEGAALFGLAQLRDPHLAPPGASAAGLGGKVTLTPWRGQSSGSQPLSRGCPLISPPQPGGHNKAQWLQVLHFPCSPPGSQCCPHPQPSMGGHGWTLTQPWDWGAGSPSSPGSEGPDSCPLHGPHPHSSTRGRDVGIPVLWPLAVGSPRDPLPAEQASLSSRETESRQKPGSAPGREPTAETLQGPAVPAQGSPSSGLLSQPWRWSPNRGEGLWEWGGQCWQKVPLSLGGARGRANSD